MRTYTNAKTREVYAYIPGRGTVKLSRFLVEQKIGRRLTHLEQVHHIDGNPSNNNIDNLELYANARDHARQRNRIWPHLSGDLVLEPGKLPRMTPEKLSWYLSRPRSVYDLGPVFGYERV